MGTDIHLWAEIRQSRAHSDGVSKSKWEAEWRTVGHVFENCYYRPEELATISWSEDEGGYEWGSPYSIHPYENRNYDVFAILAGVRNGIGFAGVDLGNGFNPIAEPRGFPSDLSDYMKHKAEEVVHTPSWLSLDELNAYDWSQTTKHCGWVDADQYQQFVRDGKPKERSGGVSGGSVRHVSNDQMQALIDTESATDRVYTQVEWCEPYSVSAGEFYDKTLPKLREIRELLNVIDLRIVFWFDS